MIERALRKAIRRDGSLDVEELLAGHAVLFGSARMADDAEDDSSEDDDTGDGGDDDADDDEGQDQLGDAGKKALDRMKARVTRERTTRKQLEQELATERAKKGKDDKGPSADEIREEARREARLEAVKETLPVHIMARAGALSAKPRLVRALIRDEFDFEEFLDNGKVDEDAIDDAIAQVLKDNPELARDGKSSDDSSDGGKKRRFGGDADGGTRNNGKGRPEQLTRDDMKRMSPKEVVEARKAGKFDDLMAGKQK